MSHGSVRLVNKTDKPYSFMFDGVQYVVPASSPDKEGFIHVSPEAATHARNKSYMSYNLETGRATYRVGIEGQDSINFIGKGKSDEEELIDRTTDPEGIPQKINVRGGNVVDSSREDALARTGE